ncbi:MAG TPA: LysR substrate-binding domain-containing protein [Sphingomonas sp.]
MSDARRLLPPIGALASFVAAARHDSFSRAGEDVGLTQSAVSRQIAVLEDWLQLALFKRSGRRVALTAEGRAYADIVGPALDRIRAATANAIARRPESELSIATLPSFGMRWLAPRLPGLTARYPDIVINIAARSFPFDFAEEPFDAAIHFGLPDWPGARHELLFREEALPVCSPARLAAQPIDTPRDVLNWPLLAQSSRPRAWGQWFALAGLDIVLPAPSGTFEHFLMLAQAAAAGSGMALIPRFLIEPELAAGTLVTPLPIALSSEEAYYLVYPERRIEITAFRHVRAWLLEEAGARRRASSPSVDGT